MAQSNSIAVDKDGSAPLRLNGALRAPDGMLFAESTQAYVRTRPVASVTATLACGKPVSSQILTCNPLATSVESLGGYFLSPPSVKISPSGGYSVALAGGICFAGAVEISVLMQAYSQAPQPGICLGEAARSEAPVVLGASTIEFQAAAVEPE